MANSFITNKDKNKLVGLYPSLTRHSILRH